MWENIKFKFNRKLAHRVLVSFLVLSLILIPLRPKQEADALAPLLAGALWVGGAIASEVAMDLGWKFLGKPAWDAIETKVMKDVANNPDSWDFPKTKPKKNGKKLDVDVSANDRQKMATLLKKYGDEVIEMDLDRKAKHTTPSYYVDIDDLEDPFYNTSIDVNISAYSGRSSEVMMLDYMSKFIDIEFTPIPYGRATYVEFIDTISGENIVLNPGGSYRKKVNGGTVYNLEMKDFGYNSNTGSSMIGLADEMSYTFYVWESAKPRKSYQMYQGYLNQLQENNRTIYVAQGVSVPEDNTKIYEIPLNTPSTYKLPWGDSISKPISIPLPDEDDSVIDIEWSEVETRQYDDDVENYQTTIINDNDPTITNNYNHVVNNYYTYEVESNEPSPEEINNQIAIIIENDIDIGTGGGGIPVVDDADKAVRVYDRTLVGYIKSVYDYLADGLDNSILALKDITDSASGLVSFLDSSFEWLPNEWRALFGSAFVMGVVAHFLRR